MVIDLYCENSLEQFLFDFRVFINNVFLIDEREGNLQSNSDLWTKPVLFYRIIVEEVDL